MRYALLASLAASILFAAGGSAQTIPSPYRYVEDTQSAGPFGGWLVTDRGDNEIGPHSAPIIGGRYTVRLSGPLSGEVGLATIPTQRTVQQRISATGDSLRLQALGDVNSLILLGEAGLRFHITGPRPWTGLAPYASLSAGGVWDALGTSDLEEAVAADQRVEFGPGFAVGAGLGTDWFLSERFVLRVEARDYLWRLTTPIGLTPAARQEETEWANNIGLTLGIAIYF